MKYEGKVNLETGKTFYKGNSAIRQKGEMYLVGCNVTGEDIGTVIEPKFALRLLWKHVLLPALDEHVAPGGRVMRVCDGSPPRGQRWLIAMPKEVS